jgi:hypothetical protein
MDGPEQNRCKGLWYGATSRLHIPAGKEAAEMGVCVAEQEGMVADDREVLQSSCEVSRERERADRDLVLLEYAGAKAGALRERLTDSEESEEVRS